jgi:hypothetical protein
MSGNKDELNELCKLLDLLEGKSPLEKALVVADGMRESGWDCVIDAHGDGGFCLIPKKDRA